MHFKASFKPATSKVNSDFQGNITKYPNGSYYLPPYLISITEESFKGKIYRGVCS